MAHTHCLAPARARERADAPVASTSYGRLFPDLPRFSADDAFLRALGRAGGLCDCGDADDSPSSLGAEAAGWPFFGQFVAHDITADRSSIRRHIDPLELRNARSPQLNLECLYGDGPVGHPYLFRRNDPAKLLLGADERDVQRNAEGTAIIGDPRNDSHVFMSQMHLAFARAHNAFVDRARTADVHETQVFDHAAKELRWHYQSVILREFMPRLIGGTLTQQILNGDRRYYRPRDEPFIPLEFADGAYRYGHSQIRHTYRISGESDVLPIFPDLMGFRPVRAEHRVDWTLLFDCKGCAPAQRAKKLDGRLVRALIALPAAMTAATDPDELHSLAMRDLERGQGVGLPSGEAVARLLGETPLSAAEIGAADAGWPGETPLWYYVLREADVRAGGDRLGPVGGRIVGEVLAGLLEYDPSSVRYAPAAWTPERSLVELLAGIHPHAGDGDE
jgi:hypothetical protein